VEVSPVINLIGYILTSNGNNMLTAVNGGGLGPSTTVALNTNRTSAAAWETFTLVLQPGSSPIGAGMKFALKTSDGNNFVTAVNGGGVGGANDVTCPVHTDQTVAKAGAWEIFSLLVNESANPPTVQIMPFTVNPKTGPFFLTAVNGGNWGATDPGNAQPIHTNATAVGTWEQFSFSALSVSTAPVNINCNTNINGPSTGNIAGSITLTVESDGSYSFSGKENNSNWLPYDISVAVVVVGADGTGYTFTVGSSSPIGAGLPFSNNNWSWLQNGINGTLQANWNTSIGLGWTWYYDVSATLDPGTLLQGLISDINAVVNIVKAVIAVIDYLAV
jgi:hypothetical protein